MENVLYEAARIYWPEREIPQQDANFFVDAETVLDEKVEYFLEKLENGIIQQWLLRWENHQEWEKNFDEPHTQQTVPAQADEQELVQEEVTEPSFDGECIIEFSSDALTAWLMVLPPIGSGKAMAPFHIAKQVEANEIVFGVIPGVCESASFEPFKVFTIAQGTPVVHGIDGMIEDLFERHTPEPEKFKENYTEEDIINFRNRKWLITVEKNQVLCKLTQPIPGTPGKTVTGKEILPKPANMPRVPKGNNTEITKEQTELVTTCEGRLIYKNNCFSVTQELIIDDHVALNIGNIVMPGDVIIKGNVEPGFSIDAKGSITVEGVIENAQLTAGKDIHLKMGVKGDGAAVLKAQGDIQCKFAENSTLFAQSITAEYLINCNISARKDLIITNGKAVLIGGTVRVGRQLKVKTIGNNTNRMISITMGITPDFLQEIQQEKEALIQQEKELEEHTKNITFLSKKETLDTVYTQLLKQLKLNQSVLMMKIGKIKKKIAQQEQSVAPENSEIIVDNFYPPAAIQVGLASYHVKKQWRMSRFLYEEGEIVIKPQ